MSQKIDCYFIVKIEIFYFLTNSSFILKSHYKRHKNFWNKLIIIFPGKDSRVHKIAEIFQLPIVNKEYKEETIGIKEHLI